MAERWFVGKRTSVAASSTLALLAAAFQMTPVGAVTQSQTFNDTGGDQTFPGRGATNGGGGTAGDAGTPEQGMPGTLFVGGAGGNGALTGGVGAGDGGGGGYYGGGGGGGANDQVPGVVLGGGGGGAGSSFAGIGTSNVSITTDTTGSPQAVVS